MKKSIIGLLGAFQFIRQWDSAICLLFALEIGPLRNCWTEDKVKNAWFGELVKRTGTGWRGILMIVAMPASIPYQFPRKESLDSLIPKVAMLTLSVHYKPLNSN